MLQALWGRSKPQAATSTENGGGQDQESGTVIEEGIQDAEIGDAETSAQSNPVKRKREEAKEKKEEGNDNKLFHGEKIQVTNGVLIKNGVKSQEGEEEDDAHQMPMQIAETRGQGHSGGLVPYQETPFGMLPPEMVLQIFSFFLDDLPFLVRSIGLTCRHWNDLASSNPLWKRVMELGLSEVLSWTSADPIGVVPNTNAPPDIEDSSYKDLFCKYHVRIRNNWENGSYSIKALTGHKDFIRCVRFDKTHRAVSSGVDRMVCVWDLKTGECIKTMKGHTGEVDSVDFHGDTVISGSFDSTVRFWDVKTGECTNVLKEAGSILMWCVHLFPESNRVLCPGSVASLALWDSEKREVLHRYTNPTSANVMSMYACGQSGPVDPLLTGSSDKIIRLWDTETGLCKLEMSGHTDSIWAVHYDQGAVITASSDRTVKMWDIRSGQCVETLKGHSGTVFCMWADGGHVVSGDSNDWLFVWELRQRRRLQSFKEHEGGLRSVQNDSHKIVSASWDKTIKVWSFV